MHLLARIPLPTCQFPCGGADICSVARLVQLRSTMSWQFGVLVRQEILHIVFAAAVEAGDAVDRPFRNCRSRPGLGIAALR